MATSKIMKVSQVPISANASGLTVPARTYTKLCEVTLPANGKYILLGHGACGAASNDTNISISFNKVSGTTPVLRLGTSSGSTVGGGPKDVVGYVETTTSTVIELREYLYESGTTSAASGWIVAIPIY